MKLDVTGEESVAADLIISYHIGRRTEITRSMYLGLDESDPEVFERLDCYIAASQHNSRANHIVDRCRVCQKGTIGQDYK